MNPLKIEATLTSPEISMDASSGKISFSGRSHPENSALFFKPVYEWLEQYALKPAAKTECSIKFEYFNSSSRKCIIDIFKIFDAMHKKGHPVTIIWNFDEGDESMQETGEEYQEIFSMDFQFVAF